MNTDTEKQKIATADIVPVQLIKVADIVPDPNNQKRDDEDGLVRLCHSIEVDGLIQPITLRPNPAAADNPGAAPFMIIAGERRWQAHKMIKREVIEARVLVGESQLASVRKRGVENLLRENLNPIQEARQYQELIDTGMSQEEAAEMAGLENQSTISNRLRILKLPPAVQNLIEHGDLSRAHGVALVRFERWPAACVLLARTAIEESEPAKGLEKGVPFSWKLESAGLIVRLYAYSHSEYTITKAMRDDPDWIIEGSTAYCFDPKKGHAEVASQDNARRLKAAKQVEKEKKSSPGGLTKEQKERRAKLAKNKAARLVLQSAQQAIGEALRERSKVAGHFDVSALEVGALLSVVIGNVSGELDEAAKTLGYTLKKSKKYYYTTADLLEIGWPQAVQLTALAFARARIKEASRHAGALPESVEAMMGAKTRARMESLVSASLAPALAEKPVVAPQAPAKKAKAAKPAAKKAVKKGAK